MAEFLPENLRRFSYSQVPTKDKAAPATGGYMLCSNPLHIPSPSSAVSL